VHKKLGLQPGWGGATRLTRLVGPQTALYMLSTAKILSAEELIDFGFCAPEIVKDMDAWLEEHLISTPKTVIRAMKKNTVNAQKYEYFTALEREREVFQKLISADESQKKIRALHQKLSKK